MNKILGPSWRTGLTGLASILATLAHTIQLWSIGQSIDWNVVVTGLVAGIGLMTARDNKVTSEQAGATSVAIKQP